MYNLNDGSIKLNKVYKFITMITMQNKVISVC